VQAGDVFHHQFLIGHSKIDAHVKELTRRGTLRALHNYAATANPAVEALERRDFLLNVVIESGTIFNISESYLNGG
jgi:hypothetical protein